MGGSEADQPSADATPETSDSGGGGDSTPTDHAGRGRRSRGASAMTYAEASDEGILDDDDSDDAGDEPPAQVQRMLCAAQDANHNYFTHIALSGRGYQIAGLARSAFKFKSPRQFACVVRAVSRTGVET